MLLVNMLVNTVLILIFQFQSVSSLLLALLHWVELPDMHRKSDILGHLGGSVGWASGFSSGHDLMVHGSESLIRLSAILCLPLCPSSTLSLFFSQKWINIKKKEKNYTFKLVCSVTKKAQNLRYWDIRCELVTVPWPERAQNDPEWSLTKSQSYQAHLRLRKGTEGKLVASYQ